MPKNILSDCEKDVKEQIDSFGPDLFENLKL